MKVTHSKKGLLSPQEYAKNRRDFFIATASVFVPQVFEFLLNTDFGAYNALIAAAIAGVSFYLNRKYNIVRPDMD